MTPDQFRNHRDNFSKSIEEFAEMLGVGPRTVRRWEAATQDIPAWLEIYLPVAAAVIDGASIATLRSMVLDPNNRKGMR